MSPRGYADAVADQAEAQLRADLEAGRVAPTPDRITAALDLRELYGPEVDAACGVAEPAVDQWEAGELVPTWDQLVALAELTGFPVPFFFREPTDPAFGATAFFCIRSGKGKGCYRGDDPRLTRALAGPPEQLALPVTPARTTPVRRPDPPPPGPLPECSGCARPMRRATWTSQHGRCSRCGPERT